MTWTMPIQTFECANGCADRITFRKRQGYAASWLHMDADESEPLYRHCVGKGAAVAQPDPADRDAATYEAGYLRLVAERANATSDVIAAGGTKLHYAFTDLDARALRRAAEVMAEGREKYGPPDKVWRRIDVEQHINHALAHLFRYLEGDTSEDHLAHAACRALGALDKALRDAEAPF